MPYGYPSDEAYRASTGQGETMNYIRKNLLRGYESNRYNGFLPDRADYDAYIDSSIEDVMAALPVAEEDYEADLASRGLRSSGEATKFKYQNVYAPLAREATSAVTRANLAYAEAYQRGAITAEEMKYRNLKTLMDLYFQREMLKFQEAQIKSGNTGDLISGGIDLATSIIGLL